MNKIAGLAAVALGIVWAARSKSRNKSCSHLEPPGTRKHLGTRLLETGAAVFQSKPPLRAMNLYLDGFHFYADDMGHQTEAHHYCNQLTEDFIQCVIFDGNTADARLIGIEYVISERLFKALPEDERKLWHSHHYEVKSGTLIAPGIPELAEHELMQRIVSTYGKTWHTWDSHKDLVPLGIPKLMAGFTADGQLNPHLIAERDRLLGISTEAKRKNREDISEPIVLSGANSWQTGQSLQLTLQGLDFESAPPHPSAATTT